MQFTGEHCETLLSIARVAIRAALTTHSPPLLHPDRHHAALSQQAGCFVSLHELESHRLRGCVGRLNANHPVSLAVHDAAVGVLKDPRFVDEPVLLEELHRLEIEITILSVLTASPAPLCFDPLRDGIYLTIGERGACFLPQVARQTCWTREQLLERLCTEKLGMNPQAWRSREAKLFTFATQIIGPTPFELPAHPNITH